MGKVYRFHMPTAVVPRFAPTLLRKRRLRPAEDAALIGSDASSLTDACGTRPIETYQDDRPQGAVTLTRREADLIALANPGVQPPTALEDTHPWLPRKRFLNDSAANYGVLCSLVRRYGRHLVTAADFCDQKWNTVCNAIGVKDDLDARFYTAWHLPIQDAAVLEERRVGRSVVAIDVNAMYPACMQQQFPKPAALRLVSCNRELGPDEDLPLGLYRCVLGGPSTDFIRRHNPFRSFFSGKYLRAALTEPVEVDLNEFETTFYRRHFARVHLVDAVVSDQGIQHPLAKEVRRSFARRRNYRAQGNKELADREKYLSTLMSSCASRPGRSRLAFRGREDAMAYLLANQGICPPADEPDSAADAWLRGSKGVALTCAPAGVGVEAPDPHTGSACFLLGQRIVARGRVVLLETMERVLRIAPDVEICYANIDSIHFSLPTAHLAAALEALRAEASEQMGSFKIEAVTRHGLWLEPGRYWLYSDAVERFRNRSVGDRLSPFRDHAVQVASRRIGDLHIPIKATLRMDRTMSDARAIVPDPESGIARQELVELGGATAFADVLHLLDDNRRRWVPERMRAFDALRLRMGGCPAPLPRGGA